LSAVLLIAAGAGMLAWLDITGKHGLDITFHNGVLRGIGDFSIGVGLAMIWRAVKARGGEVAPEWMHSIIQTIVVLFLLIAIYHSGWSHQWRDIYLVPPMMALIFALAFDRGIVARVLQTAPLQKMGEWSYAIYLGQTAWLHLIRFIEQRFLPTHDTIVLGMRWAVLFWWIEPAVLVVICLIWGTILAKTIEIPASRVLRRWFDQTAKARRDTVMS
jgi:peptidoglycan/LPS O-acetylase OafA/YrhL